MPRNQPVMLQAHTVYQLWTSAVRHIQLPVIKLQIMHRLEEARSIIAPAATAMPGTNTGNDY